MNASTPLLLALALALIAFFAQARVLSSDIDNGKAGLRSVPPTLPVPTLPNSTGANTCGVMENGQVRPLRVVVAITDGYLPVFVNWLLHFRNICPSLSSLYIICLDSKVEKMLPTIGLACATVHHGTKEHSVWTNTMIGRVKMPHHLLQEGYDVLFSDIDAYWIRNPFPTRKPLPLNPSKLISNILYWSCLPFSSPADLIRNPSLQGLLSGEHWQKARCYPLYGVRVHPRKRAHSAPLGGGYTGNDQV
jgi:hypothetical protein